jgi:hypothetical protein
MNALRLIHCEKTQRLSLPSFRCKLRNEQGQTMDYIGVFGAWPLGWHIVVRRGK